MKSITVAWVFFLIVSLGFLMRIVSYLPGQDWLIFVVLYLVSGAVMVLGLEEKI